MLLMRADAPIHTYTWLKETFSVIITTRHLQLRGKHRRNRENNI